MLLRAPPTLDPETSHELRVLLPEGLYVRLHARKILTGETISAMLTEALEAYFRQRDPSSVRVAPGDEPEG